MRAFYPEWQKIIRIDVTNPPTTTGYQVKVEIPWQPGMKDDFSDLRFSDYARTLPYWIETSTSRVTATVWVKLTQINQAAKEFFCYYGNGAATSESNGETVFDFFDHFDTTLNTTNWYDLGGTTISNSIATITADASASHGISSKTTDSFQRNYALRAKAKSLHNQSTTYYERITWGEHYTGYVAHYGQWVYFSSAGNVDQCSNYNGGETFAAFPLDADTWTTIEIQRDTSQANFMKNNSLQNSISSSYYYTQGMIAFHTYGSGSTLYVDWALIRKFQTTEPTCTISNSGTNIRIIPVGIIDGEGTYYITLTAVQHLSHNDLTWSIT